LTDNPSRLWQLHHNGPERTPVGDCYRTALACLFGLDNPERVPHFVDIELQHRSIHQPSVSHLWAREWIRDATGGCDLASCPATVIHDLAVLEGVPIYGVATVPGHRATWHCVVWESLTNACWHDPTPPHLRTKNYTADDVTELEVVVLPWEPGPNVPGTHDLDLAVYPLLRPWRVDLVGATYSPQTTGEQ